MRGSSCQQACITSYLLHCRVAAGLGRSYHIRVTSERSIPIRGKPRNSHQPSLQFPSLCSACLCLCLCSACNIAVLGNPSLLSWAPRASHQNASFSPKRSNYCTPAPGGRWHRENAENSADCVCFAPTSCWSGWVAFLQFRFYALFTFLLLPSCWWSCPATCLCFELVWQLGWSPPWPATQSFLTHILIWRENVSNINLSDLWTLKESPPPCSELWTLR